MGKGFDEYAPAYDAWFLENRNVLYSEINLVAHVLKNPGRTLSVGCGSGLFETILAKEYGITITDGIEPSEGMAEIARKRGMEGDDLDRRRGRFRLRRLRYDSLQRYPQLHHRSGKRRPQSLRRPARRRPDHPDRRSEREHLRCAVQPGQSLGTWIIRCSRGPIPRIPIRSNSSGSPTGARRPRRSSCSKKPDSGISASPRPSPRTRSTRTGRKSSRRKVRKGRYVAVTACK